MSYIHIHNILQGRYYCECYKWKTLRTENVMNGKRYERKTLRTENVMNGKRYERKML